MDGIASYFNLFLQILGVYSQEQTLTGANAHINLRNLLVIVCMNYQLAVAPFVRVMERITVHSWPVVITLLHVIRVSCLASLLSQSGFETSRMLARRNHFPFFVFPLLTCHWKGLRFRRWLVSLLWSVHAAAVGLVITWLLAGCGQLTCWTRREGMAARLMVSIDGSLSLWRAFSASGGLV